MRRGAASHPEVVGLQADLLWSINERLAGREGLDLPRLGTAWLDDVLTAAAMETNSAPAMDE